MSNTQNITNLLTLKQSITRIVVYVYTLASNSLLDLSGRLFYFFRFFPGSNPMFLSDERQNRILSFFSYVSQKSVCNDSAASTYDLEVDKKTD